MLIPNDIRLIDLTVAQWRQILREEMALLSSSGSDTAAGSKVETVPIEKLSELTGWSKSAIYKKCSLRILPHSKVGKELRFDMNEINEWIAKQKRKTGDELARELESRHKHFIKRSR